MSTDGLLSTVKKISRMALLRLLGFGRLPLKEEYARVLAADPSLFGTERYCNICGYRFSRFALCNPRKPRGEECPVCKSRERHRHLYIHICSLFPFLKGKKVLHFAPEEIFKKIFFESEAEYYDADIDPQRAKYLVDITNITFVDNFFDYIFCIHVLEHIPNDRKALGELFRVLKPGGVAYLAVPLGGKFLEDLSVTDPEERLRLYRQEDHVRMYNLKVFTERVEAAGFRVELSRPEKFPKVLKDANFKNIIVVAHK